MTTDPSIRAQGYQYFLQEAPELLQVLEQGLLTLQEDSSINKVNTLMRATHTLKGAAASLELTTIAKVAHSLEDVFRALCRPQVFIDAEVEALLFEGFECLRLASKAELTEATVNDNEILNRIAAIIAQLQDALGDCFDQDAPLPTSTELGFDVTQSIFEVGVTQRLDQLAAVLEAEPSHGILPVLQTQVEVFLGLGESLDLPGFAAIAQTTIAALDHHPDHIVSIARLALQDFQAGQAAVLAGDRDQGGCPSEALQALAHIPTDDHDQVDVDVLENAVAMVEDVTALEAIVMVEGPTAAEEAVIVEEAAIVETLTTLEEAALVEATRFLAPGSDGEKPSLSEQPATVDATATSALVPAEGNTSSTEDMTAVFEEIVRPIADREEVSPDTSEEERVKSSSDLDEVDPDALANVEASTVTEATAPPGQPQPVAEATARPGIHKLFQWMRKSVSGGMPEAPKADLPEPSEATARPEQASEVVPASGIEIPETATALENTADASESGHDPAAAIAAVPTDGTDATADPFLDHAGGDEAANTLLEDIWGGTAATAAAIDTATDAAIEPHSRAISITPEAITPKVNAGPADDFEILHPTDRANPANSQQPLQQPTPLRSKGVMPAAPTVRIQVEHLDQLNYTVGELLTNHNQQSLQAEQIQAAMRHLYARLEQHQLLLGQLQDWIDQPAQQDSPHGRRWPTTPLSPPIPSSFQSTFLHIDEASPAPRRSPTEFDVLELEQYSEPQLVIQSLLDDTVQLTEAVDAVEMFTRQSRQTQEKQGRLLLKTRDALIEGRMFPLGQLFERFPRILQQLETLHHKPVELTLHGTEVLVDKAIGEKLYDPLLHLVRNAFDHGIESATVRHQQAKPKAGQLEMAAYHQGKHLVIEVRDDGQGLNFERIRQRAIERQLAAPEEAYRLNQAQLTDLLFEPGFSTASQISSLSGRGVGLDVVRSQLQALQGEVAVTSVAQQGTTFTLRIPLSLTIAKLLVCQSANRTYALLPDAIEQIVIPQKEQIQQREHCRALQWGEGQDARLVPIYALSELLDYHEQAQRLPTQSDVPFLDRTLAPHILLIRHQGVLLGLEVDQMMGEQELVIRPLNPLLATHKYLYGASILADGRLTLVLDGATLAEVASKVETDTQVDPRSPSSAVGKLLAPAHSEHPPVISGFETSATRGQKLLVVDDSITTRQTLILSLQKAGYQVIQAQDGQAAIEQLLRHPTVQLVICDIEMPRMNGFEFLQHCQHDPELAGVPVMMLSSRSSDKHRLLAEQLGAIAYISKPYLEHRLLEMVAEILQADVLQAISG